MQNISQNTALIRDYAARLGFDFCGIAAARALDEDARKLEQWLNKGYHGSMHYMQNHFDLRTDPTKLFPGAKSVITLLMNYYPAEIPEQQTDYKISRYAYGNDYHELIRGRLKIFLELIREGIGNIEGRGFVDSAPVLERSWAVRSGLGWVGKNGNLINKTQGSFFFISTLITDLELESDDPFSRDYCGSCRRCIDACPTDAILENKVIDGSRCISYFTIELKEMLIPEEMKGKFDNWAFGCDTCQEVCPWNRFSKPSREESFRPIPELFSLSKQDWEEMSEDSFRKIFRHSPLKRSKLKGIQRNLRFLDQQ